MVQFVSDKEAREDDPFAGAPRRKMEYSSKSLYDQLKESKEENEKTKGQETNHYPQTVNDDEVHFLKEQERTQKLKDEQIRQTEEHRLKMFKKHMADAEAALQAPQPPEQSDRNHNETDKEKEKEKETEQLVRTDVVDLSSVKLVPQRKNQRRRKKRRRPSLPTPSSSHDSNNQQGEPAAKKRKASNDDDGDPLLGGGLVDYGSE